MKFVEKVFTKELKKDIMRKKYNPFEVKRFTKEGLIMNETEKEVLCELMEESNLLKRFIFRTFKRYFIKVYKKGVKNGFNWSNNVR